MKKQKKYTTNTSVNVVIPKRSLWSFLALVATLVFTYFQAVGYLLPQFGEISKLEPENTTINHIGLMWVPIISYLLISLSVCLLINIFKELKDFKEEGLIRRLTIAGLVLGLVMSGLGALILGLVFLSGSILLGFLKGFIIGLYVSLFFGLIIGIIDEFKS